MPYKKSESNVNSILMDKGDEVVTIDFEAGAFQQFLSVVQRCGWDISILVLPHRKGGTGKITYSVAEDMPE